MTQKTESPDIPGGPSMGRAGAWHESVTALWLLPG